MKDLKLFGRQFQPGLATKICHPCQLEGLTRRQLLTTGASISASLSLHALLPALALGAERPAVLRRLVWVNMSGGWDILEVTDPKPASTSGIDMTYDWGLAAPIAGGSAEQKIGRWLGRIAALGKDMVVVRGLAMGTTSHQAGMVYMDTGILANTGRVNVASVPSIVASNAQATIPIIQLSGGSEPLLDRGVSVSVVRAQNLELYRSMYPSNSSDLDQKFAILDHLRGSIERVKAVSGESDRLTAINNAEAKIRTQLEGDVGAKLTLNPGDLAPFAVGAPQNLNRGMRDAFALALKLLKNDLVTCVNLGIGGFDTHAGQEARLMPILTGFDHVMGVFVNELRASGQLDNTLIVCYSDFGRTPKVNASNGRDHWPVGGALMVGGGIKGGRVVGGTNGNLQAEPINLTTGAVDPSGIGITPANLAGSVLALTLGEAFVKANRSYLEPVSALVALADE